MASTIEAPQSHQPEDPKNNEKQEGRPLWMKVGAGLGGAALVLAGWAGIDRAVSNSNRSTESLSASATPSPSEKMPTTPAEFIGKPNHTFELLNTVPSDELVAEATQPVPDSVSPEEAIHQLTLRRNVWFNAAKIDDNTVRETETSKLAGDEFNKTIYAANSNPQLEDEKLARNLIGSEFFLIDSDFSGPDKKYGTLATVVEPTSTPIAIDDTTYTAPIEQKIYTNFYDLEGERITKKLSLGESPDDTYTSHGTITVVKENGTWKIKSFEVS